jgi:hypothetical protein
MIMNEAGHNTTLVLIHAPFEVVGVADIEIAAATVQQVRPEAQKQSFDKLRTNGE